MVDFKYHVVSIVAVFLALAVGIVLGTNVLSGDVLKNLKAQTSDLRKEAQDLRTQNDAQLAQVNAAGAFAQAVEPLAVAGRLAGRSVVVIMLPTAQKTVRDDAAQALTDAGATVTGEIDISATFVDPTQSDALGNLVTSLTGSAEPLDVPSASAPASPDAAGRAATLLASSLVGTGAAAPTAFAPAQGLEPSPDASASPPVPIGSSAPTLDVTSTESLAGLQKAGFIKIDQAPTGHADFAVIIAPGAPAKPDASTASSNAALLELVAAFPAAGGATVVAAPSGSAGTGGVLAAIRGSSAVSKSVSSVDDVDAAPGQIATVLALQAGGLGQIGQYGTGPGAQGPLPTPSTT
jgi:hypothetical protein